MCEKYYTSIYFPKVCIESIFFCSQEADNGEGQKKAKKGPLKDQPDSAVACSSKDPCCGKSSKSAEQKRSKEVGREDKHNSRKKQSKYFKDTENLKEKGGKKKTKGQIADNMKKCPKTLKSGLEKESHDSSKSSESQRSSRNLRSKTRESGDSKYSHGKTKTERSSRTGKGKTEQAIEPEELVLR